MEGLVHIPVCNNNKCLLLLSIDPKTVHIIEPVPAPESVGEEAAALKTPSPGILSNFSFTNLKTEIKNIRLLKLFKLSFHFYAILPYLGYYTVDQDKNSNGK